jgi:hypothetical protein
VTGATNWVKRALLFNNKLSVNYQEVIEGRTFSKRDVRFAIF